MKRLLVLAAVVALICSQAPVEAAERVLVIDILSNPARWVNRSIELKGEAFQVTEGPGGGTYSLRDQSTDDPIIVRIPRGHDFPRPGSTVVVEGIFAQQPGIAPALYYLREVSRCEPRLLGLCDGPLPPVVWAIIAAALVAAGLVVALVSTLRRQPESDDTIAVSEDEEVLTSEPGTVEVLDPPARVEVLSGPRAGTTHPVGRRTTFSRTGGNVPLADPTVSRGVHAAILYDNGAYRIVNYHRKNPIKCNGERVNGSMVLKDGDDLHIGRVRVRFGIEE